MSPHSAHVERPEIDAQLKMVYTSRFFSSLALLNIENNYGSFKVKLDQRSSATSYNLWIQLIEFLNGAFLFVRRE